MQKGCTALRWAAGGGHLWTARALLAAGARIESRSEDDYTPFIDSVVRGHLDVVEMLMKAGADADARDKGGYNALLSAAYNGHPDIAILLLAAGADLEARTKVRLTWRHSRNTRSKK